MEDVSKATVSFLTFVIPTLGRPSLSKAIDSIVSQPDWNWKCVVMFDGIEPTISSTSDNILLKSCDKKGHAGLVRNEALPFVDTKWVAFLDDDDYILPTYMERLKYIINHYEGIDIVIFSYRDISNGNVQPPPYLNDLVACNVGISFAARMDFIKEHNILFTHGGVEDFAFLDECRRHGAKFVITHEVQYIVTRRSEWL